MAKVVGITKETVIAEKSINETYNDLIMTVEDKASGETRHETAKRLITQAQKSKGAENG